MLFKALALLTLGIGNTFAIPSFAIMSQISPNVYRSASTFEEMKNGDYSVKGKGSVTDELTSYGVDTFNYSLGVKDSTILTVSESNNCVYVYLYSKIKSIDYDKISLCAYSTNVIDRIFTEYEMFCVSYNVNKTLSKYEIINLDPSESYHSYTVREAYVNSNKGDMNYIIGSSCSVAFNPDNKKSTTVREDCVNVTNKVVAYELALPDEHNDQSTVYQSNYCAFSIDRNIEDITKVNVGYYSQKFGGVTNISTKWGDDHVFPYLVNQDLFYKFDSNNRKVGSKEYHNEVIGSKEQEIIIYKPGDIFKWFSSSFDTSTIKKISDIDLSKFSGSESIDSFQYLLRFDLTKFKIGYAYTSNQFATIAPDLFATPISGYSFVESNAPIQVTDFTIFQLWFLEKGEEKDVIVVDSYSDTIGGNQIQDPTHDDVWSQIMSKIVQSLKQFLFWLMNNWWAWLIVGILLLPVAYPVAKIVWFLLKIIAYIISLPFKLLIHLFGGD